MRLTRRRLLTTLGATALAPLAIGLSPLALAGAPPHLDTATLVVHGRQGPHRLEVEVAREAAERARGLMERERLAANAGMLFVYGSPRSADSAFWMYRTRIPLDIAFIDAEGRIAAIRRMPPCDAARSSDCPSYRAGVTYQAALEVNAGYFAERGIEVGDCLTLPDGAGACRP